MFDLLGEILETMRRNKLRTFLTGFAVAWGIFMLIVLLAMGNGLQNGVKSNMRNQATNTMYLNPGWTSMPYKGLRANRRIRFDNRTVDFVRKNVPEVDALTGYIWRSTTSVSYGEEYGTWMLEAAMPEVAEIMNFEIVKGRFLNDIDEAQQRKVAVIGKATEETLFVNGEDPLGKYIVIDGIAFQVIGVWDTPWSPNNNPSISIPFSVGNKLYNRGWGVSGIEFTIRPGAVTTIEEGDALEKRVREVLGPYLGFDPTDRSAMYIWNNAKGSLEMQNVFSYLEIFLWVIGFASLMAGLVGVANIMLVTVKERTREIGIRKALGASPWSIIKSVIIEAVFITSVAGYLGIMAGVGIMEVVARQIGSVGSDSGGYNGQGMTMFKDPTVGLGIVFSALLLLVVCGVVAGLIPPLRATRTKPIEAMRAD